MKSNIDLGDAQKWLDSLRPEDTALKDETTKITAKYAYLAGAQAQLHRLFPHLADKETP